MTPLSLCLPVDDQVFATAKLIQSDKDLLILNHLNDDFPSLSLSGEQMLPGDPWGTSLARDTSMGMSIPSPHKGVH